MLSVARQLAGQPVPAHSERPHSAGFGLDSKSPSGNSVPVRPISGSGSPMAALRILCLILLSGGLLTQPVLLQAASCCCAQDVANGISQTDSELLADSTEGCPHCRSTRNSSDASVATLRACTCQKHSAPVAVARAIKVAPAEIQFAAVEPFEHLSEPSVGPSTLTGRNHPSGRVIPVRILKCSWRL